MIRYVEGKVGRATRRRRKRRRFSRVFERQCLHFGSIRRCEIQELFALKVWRHRGHFVTVDLLQFEVF